MNNRQNQNDYNNNQNYSQYYGQNYNPNNYPNNYYQQGYNGFPPQGKNNNNDANNLCVISLLLMYVFPLISWGISIVTGGLGSFLSALTPLSVIAAYILMIVARVKEPNNKFAKVLMIIYLIQIFLVVFLVIISTVLLAVLIKSCCGGLHGGAM